MGEHGRHLVEAVVVVLDVPARRRVDPTGHRYHRPLDPLPIDRTTELINTDPDPPPF